jgi:predicted deacylase
VFVTGAVHGDEINGTGIVRSLILRPPFELGAGTLLLVPVVNILGFERHARYLPDRRDLNRRFPGSPDGSLASRFANRIFDEVVTRADYGIDLHTAAVRRVNFPNVRGDLSEERCRRMALAFGSEVIVSSKGPKGSLRRAACAADCPTIILEAGEVWKVEPGIVDYGRRGIRNVLIDLGMVVGKPTHPPYQLRVTKTTWLRAAVGGFLEFHVTPGSVVHAGQLVATNTSLTGREQNRLEAPVDGVVLGMTTLPAVAPGNPVCQIAVRKKGLEKVRKAREALSRSSLHERVRKDLARSVTALANDE